MTLRSGLAGYTSMDFAEYTNAFRKAALAQHRDEAYIASCLDYAAAINRTGAAVVYDVEHLSLLVGYDTWYVLGAAYATERFYRRFKISKKAVGFRTIHEPLPSLKEIQRWILDHILTPLPVSSYAKGFVRGRSIKDNAKFHKGQRQVLSLDLKDFFPSINRSRTFRLFREIGYSVFLSNIFSRLCTRSGVLPQGAPTSPAISNLITRRLDTRLAAFARHGGVRYTRYADDLTFSGTFEAGQLVRFVRNAAREEGFVLNDEKTRLMESHQRQEVTGIVVNRRMHAAREQIRDLRQSMYFIRRFGLNSHMMRVGISRANYVKHLMGIANFILFVDHRNREARAALEYLRRLRLEA